MSEPKHLTRPSLRRTRPLRGTAGLYRTAGDEKAGLGGLPLTTAEDAMVAAVRMAYDIADNQITRSKRLADRLKGAANRAAGAEADSDQGAEDALDGAGRLVNNALLSGMSWVEALMGAEDGLAPRLAAAQLRAARSVLFGERGARPAAPEAGERAGGATSGGPTYAPETTIRGVRILLPKTNRRAVRIVRWDVETVVRAELVFRLLGEGSQARLQGALEPPGSGDARPILRMTSTPATSPAGAWRAAVCDEHGEQFGIIEIEI